MHEFASLRLREETVDALRRIAARDGVTIAELIERSVATYERQRLETANARGKRQAGETDDAFIRRVLRPLPPGAGGPQSGLGAV